MHRHAVALRHVEFEDLGLLAGVLHDQGYSRSYLDAPVNDGGWDGARDADLLIVLGGPIGVGDVAEFPFLADELEVIAARIADDRPTLGICLGAQLMAAAAGGSVTPGEAAEIGFAPLDIVAGGAESVLAPLSDAPAVLHWHQDVVTAPVGMDVLASTATCAVQAFARGSNILGLQFHLEATVGSVERWLVAYVYELAARGIDIGALRTDAARYGAELSARAVQVFDAWLSGLRF